MFSCKSLACCLIITAGNIIAGVYRYTEDLLALERASQSAISIDLPECCQHIITPLRVDKWEAYLQLHPDREFASFLLRGMVHGYHIGCNYSNAVILSAESNMPAAHAHAEVVVKYLHKELELGRIASVPHESSSLIHTSSFGVIPKKNQPGKWRLIVDLSSPHGASVSKLLRRLLLTVWSSFSSKALQCYCRCIGTDCVSPGQPRCGVYNPLLG